MKQDWRTLLATTCVVIPAYNEAESVASVIEELKKLSKKITIVVVNDGSSDATSQVASKAGAVVIDLPFNTGIGGAVQTGLKYALQHKFDYALQVDADGQHPPSEIHKLFSASSHSTDLVIGSRFIKSTSYTGLPGRNAAINGLSAIIRVLYQKKVYDPTSGFRLYGQRALRLFSQSYPADFPEPESVVSALNNNLSIKEVSVQMKPREKGQTSIRNLKGLYLITAILLSIFTSIFQKGRGDDDISR